MLNPDGLLSTMDAIHVYTFYIIVCIATTLFRSFLYMKVSMNSSSNLHNIMFFNLLQACMSFFYNNPSARNKPRLCLTCLTSIRVLTLIIKQLQFRRTNLYTTGNVAGSKVGLAIPQSLILIVCLQYTIKQFLESVSMMTSVERILQYTNLPKEKPITSDNPSPPT
ncbi:hypothetical protein ALC56_04046 [Trachymyrmex septentrionalis]|uniref:Uncharacterized protein n=1 Tax=Trachymyrmex septentrionalis TaxID=34720 RepID=A0A151JYW7_9HYME|nr:hypothetical protein ALC56_04046 [Trachymyrmex septentrionalis]